MPTNFMEVATNAPFTIFAGSGSKMAHVNFNQGMSQWQQLGTVKNARYVQEINAANGAIIVDAIKFERVAP